MNKQKELDLDFFKKKSPAVLNKKEYVSIKILKKIKFLFDDIYFGFKYLVECLESYLKARAEKKIAKDKDVELIKNMVFLSKANKEISKDVLNRKKAYKYGFYQKQIISNDERYLISYEKNYKNYKNKKGKYD